MADGKNANKSVLMLCAEFFDYSKIISKELSQQGYQVDLYDERPGTGFLDKTMIRLNAPWYHPMITRYYRKIIEKNRGKAYDYVFVIKGEAVTPEAIRLLRQAYPKAEFILYLWDAVENIPDCPNRMKLYDRVLTFDPADAETFHIPFRPMYYAAQYLRASQKEKPCEYDLTFIGTAHSIRPRVVKQLAEQCQQMGKRCFLYLYTPHALVYAYNKLTNPNFRYIKWKQIHTDTLSLQQVSDIYSRSRCILDIEHTRQRGLTTRPFEMMSMGKKVITTSALIQSYDFYDPRNFCIIDPDHPVLDEAFFSSPYVPVPPQIMERYSVTSFVKEIFEGSC